MDKYPQWRPLARLVKDDNKLPWIRWFISVILLSVLLYIGWVANFKILLYQDTQHSRVSLQCISSWCQSPSKSSFFIVKEHNLEYFLQKDDSQAYPDLDDSLSKVTDQPQIQRFLARHLSNSEVEWTLYLDSIALALPQWPQALQSNFRQLSTSNKLKTAVQQQFLSQAKRHFTQEDLRLESVLTFDSLKSFDSSPLFMRTPDNSKQDFYLIEEIISTEIAGFNLR